MNPTEIERTDKKPVSTMLMFAWRVATIRTFAALVVAEEFAGQAFDRAAPDGLQDAWSSLVGQ